MVGPQNWKIAGPKLKIEHAANSESYRGGGGGWGGGMANLVRGEGRSKRGQSAAKGGWHGELLYFWAHCLSETCT